MFSAVGPRGNVVQIGGIDTVVLSILDETGGARWSRRSKHAGRSRLPEVAVSSDGSVAIFTDGFTGALEGAKTTPSALPATSLVMLDPRGNIAWSDAMLPADGRGRDDSLLVHALAFEGDDLLVLGQATRPQMLGGKLVSSNPGGSLFLGRLDATGAAKWVRTFERGIGLAPQEPAQLLRGRASSSPAISLRATPRSSRHAPELRWDDQRTARLSYGRDRRHPGGVPSRARRKQTRHAHSP